jgi:DNA-binding MurR/RpiR family transcriptional regulator
MTGESFRVTDRATSSVIDDMADTAPVSARIRARSPYLQPALRRVADALLDNPERTVRLTVSEVADLAEASPTTVVRCCQSLGFVGYHELKLALAHELGFVQSLELTDTHIKQDDPVEVILERTLTADALAVRQALSTISPVEFGRAVDVVVAARRIMVAGIGTSAPIAQDAAYRLLTIGLMAEAHYDAHVQHVAASMLEETDACLIVSHTGSTTETIAVANAARQAGAATIAITSHSRSPLVDAVDIALVCGASDSGFRLAAMPSRIGHLSVADALYVAAALRLSERAEESIDRAEKVISRHRV